MAKFSQTPCLSAFPMFSPMCYLSHFNLSPLVINRKTK
nr:MAG TPA: hypothetical protein [Caudoviricetes sp.]